MVLPSMLTLAEVAAAMVAAFLIAPTTQNNIHTAPRLYAALLWERFHLPVPTAPQGHRPETAPRGIRGHSTLQAVSAPHQRQTAT